jgi:hypothetical protein
MAQLGLRFSAQFLSRWLSVETLEEKRQLVELCTIMPETAERNSKDNDNPAIIASSSGLLGSDSPNDSQPERHRKVD